MKIGNEEVSIRKDVIFEGDDKKHLFFVISKKLKDVKFGEICGPFDARRFTPCNEDECYDGVCPFCKDGDCLLAEIQEAAGKVDLDAEIEIVRPLGKSKEGK
jgi:hypothetical protein